MGKLMRNISPINAHSSPKAPHATMSVQTRIVPMVAIIWFPFRLVAGSSPALLCCAPECRAWFVYPARQYHGQSGR